MREDTYPEAPFDDEAPTLIRKNRELACFFESGAPLVRRKAVAQEAWWARNAMMNEAPPHARARATSAGRPGRSRKTAPTLRLLRATVSAMSQGEAEIRFAAPPPPTPPTPPFSPPCPNSAREWFFAYLVATIAFALVAAALTAFHAGG